MGIDYGTEDVRSFFTYDSAITELTSLSRKNSSQAAN